MSPYSALYAALFYGATLVFVAGLAWRIYEYARTPAPLRIPTTPAPLTHAGAAWRLAREALFFESLFRSSLWTWIFGWTFHVSLALVLARHLRYFVQPVPAWVEMVQPFGVYGGLGMLLGLGGLWVRRVAVDRVRYISTPSDHLLLALLVAIAATGLAMKYVAHTDVIAVKAFFAGLLTLTPRELPRDALVATHLALVALLGLVFPFSKLLHAPALFFSPTRNQPDDSRESRHLAPWAARLESKAGGEAA